MLSLPTTTSECALRRSLRWSLIFHAKAASRSAAPRSAPCSFQNPALRFHPPLLRLVSPNAPSFLPWRSMPRILARASFPVGGVYLLLVAPQLELRRRQAFRALSRSPAPRPCAARAICRKPG